VSEPEDDDDAVTPERIAALMDLGARLARWQAVRAKMVDYTDELCGQAHLGLARALAAYDPSRGPVTPFAAAWMKGAVRKAVSFRQNCVTGPPSGATIAHTQEADDGLGYEAGEGS
jgi:hypothetical protein